MFDDASASVVITSHRLTFQPLTNEQNTLPVDLSPTFALFDLKINSIQHATSKSVAVFTFPMHQTDPEHKSRMPWVGVHSDDAVDPLPQSHIPGVT